MVAAPKKETMASGYRTRLASGSGYSQNQSQGIELDVYKEKEGTETEGMAPAEGGVLWHSRSRGRGSHGRRPWAAGRTNCYALVRGGRRKKVRVTERDAFSLIRGQGTS